MTNYKLPPIIEDWISKINDTALPEHIRENYCMMLDQVILFSGQAVAKFRRSKDVSSRKQQDAERRRLKGTGASHGGNRLKGGRLVG